MSYLKHIDEQLTLRQFAEHDAADFFRVVDVNREAIGSFMLWVRKVDSEEKVRSMIAGWLEEHERSGSLCLGVYQDGRLMGAVFHLCADRKHQRVEIGYWLAADARGKGLATRAVKAMFDLTFDELGFHRGCLCIAPHNDKSVAIAQRLGLEREGLLRDQWQFEPGVFWDCEVYATTADRWSRGDGGDEPDALFVPRRHGLRNGESVTIRRATERDAEALLDYVKAMREESWGVLASPEDKPMTLAQERAWIRDTRENPAALQLLAIADDGRVVAAAGVDGGTKHRRRHAAGLGISVARSHWRQGLGRAILEWLISFAREHSAIHVVELGVFTFNHRAIALYESFGFERDGVRRTACLFEDGSYGDEMIMSCWVGPGDRPAGRSHDPFVEEASA